MRLTWDCRDAYREAGIPLTGSAVVTSELADPLPGVELQLNVTDREGRTLQRCRRVLDVQPGANAAVPLRLTALDLPIGDYGLTLALLKDGTVLQQQSRQLHHAGPYDFTQELVYAPWGDSNPNDARLLQAFKDFGLNAGSMATTARAGTTGMSAPQAIPPEEWPGDWVAQMIGFQPYYTTAEQFGKLVHERIGGATTIHHWDETEVQIVSSVRGDVAPVSSVLYRNWLKSRYFTLAALNDAWRKDYLIYHPSARPAGLSRELWSNPSKKIPPPRDWDGDLTSWNQIWLYRGAKQDWEYYAGSLWTDLIWQSRNEFHKYDRDHPWIWYDTFHTRLYPGTRPNELSYQEHESQAALGNDARQHHAALYDPYPHLARHLAHGALRRAGGRGTAFHHLHRGLRHGSRPGSLGHLAAGLYAQPARQRAVGFHPSHPPPGRSLPRRAQRALPGGCLPLLRHPGMAAGQRHPAPAL